MNSQSTMSPPPIPPLADEADSVTDSSLSVLDMVEPGQPGAKSAYLVAPQHVSRTRNYAFAQDEKGEPVELGSGRFAKAYLGHEQWVESKTTYDRKVAIKVLQKGVSSEDQLRFQLEKEILERVQGHTNIIEVLASGESDHEGFIPPTIRDRVENDFMVLELLDLSLEERLKGSRSRRRRDDLLAKPFEQRIFRVLDYILPVACAVEYAHLVRDTCHRDIKPANVLLKLPDPRLRGSRLEVKLADFNVGKAEDPDMDVSMTQLQTVPGTLYFQSPEQETNHFELLVNVGKGSPEIEYFEDFYIDIHENDQFSLFNRNERYKISGADRSRKRVLLARPWAEADEQNVRAKVTKAVGRPADIYSLGALFYYLVTGAYGNPKALYDAFRQFIEYERKDESNTVAGYIDHEYRIIQNLRTPKEDQDSKELAPEDRFFSYKHYLDGNGDLVDQGVMQIIAQAMVRGKPDSYCDPWDLQTEGISEMVEDLIGLSLRYGVDPATRAVYQDRDFKSKRNNPMRRAWDKLSNKRHRQEKSR